MKLYFYEDVVELLTQLSNKIDEQLSPDELGKFKKFVKSFKSNNPRDVNSDIENLSYLRNACHNNEANAELNALLKSVIKAVKQLHAIQHLGNVLEVFIKTVDKQELEKKWLILDRIENIVANIQEAENHFQSVSYFKENANYIKHYAKQLPSDPCLEIAINLITKIIALGGGSLQTQPAYSQALILMSNDNATLPQIPTSAIEITSQSFQNIIASSLPKVEGETAEVTLEQALRK